MHDALDLGSLSRTFDAVIDSGLFHVFSDENRVRYERELRGVLRPGGSYHVLCFSDLQPGTEGPRRVTQAELRATFGAGWEIRSIDEVRFQTLLHPGGARSWLAYMIRR